MSDKDDSTAPLGDSEVLSVQHSPGDAIPEFPQRPDDGSHVPSCVRGQETGDVFEDKPAGRKALQEPGDVPEKSGPCPRTHACTTAGHAEVLARESCREDGPGRVGSCRVDVIWGELLNVVVDRDAGEAAGEDRAGGRVRLAEQSRGDAGAV